MPTTKVYDLGLRGILAGYPGHPTRNHHCTLYFVFFVPVQVPILNYFLVSKIPHLWCKAHPATVKVVYSLNPPNRIWYGKTTVQSRN